MAKSFMNSKEFAGTLGYNKYGVAVVNPGESFLYTGGQWMDWSEYEVPLRDWVTETMEKIGFTGVPVVTDNFSIKAYLVYRPETAPQE